MEKKNAKINTKSVNKKCSTSLKFNKFIIVETSGIWWRKMAFPLFFCAITLTKFEQKYSLGLRGSVGASKSHKLKVPGSNPGQHHILFLFFLNL